MQVQCIVGRNATNTIKALSSCLIVCKTRKARVVKWVVLKALSTYLELTCFYIKTMNYFSKLTFYDAYKFIVDCYCSLLQTFTILTLELNCKTRTSDLYV